MNPLYLKYGASSLIGAASSLILDKSFEKSFPSKGRILLLGATNIALGVGASLYFKNQLGFAYAVGSSLPTIVRSFTYSSPIRLDASGREMLVFETDQDAEAYFAHVNLALDRAYAEWELNVTEPSQGGNWQRIDEYIRSPDGLFRTSAKEYLNDNDFAWCGAFVAYAWGPQVHLDIRKKMASCTSMFEAWKDTPRYIEDKVPQIGDIVTVFPNDTDRSHAPGTHLLLAASEPDSDGFFDSFEGNTTGLGPLDNKIEGVVYRTRNLNRIANVYRLLPEDFVDFYVV